MSIIKMDKKDPIDTRDNKFIVNKLFCHVEEKYAIKCN